ncbi:MAG: proline dehydrogenase family protein [Anaerolineales bacterium]|nr:MAG: proline dehydrogenase family protein [Anaerolineales bacterium]
MNVLEYFYLRGPAGKIHGQDGTMLRSFLIYLSKAAWAQKLITSWGFAVKAASRFVAGNTAQDAIRVVRELNAKGINATLDSLGEHTSTAEEANAAADAIVQVLQEVDKAGVKANVSIKLTQIGMGLDEETCRQNLVRILEQAKQSGNFIRIDMEDTPYTDITIGMYHSMLERDFPSKCVGMVQQSYLFRAEADTRSLLEKGARIRLVKGAYNEPPDKAFPKKTDTDSNFDLLAKLMIDAAVTREQNSISADGRIPPYVVIASHDDKRVGFAKKHAEKIGLPKNAIEFQMLYGIRRDLQDQLIKEGYPVRVYVPFGTQWYPYFMRRLAERPANIWFFVSNYFRK